MPKKAAAATEAEAPRPADAKVLDLSAKLQEALSGKIETPGPGIYRNVPAETYHRWDAISNSRLTLLDRSPAHLKEAIDHPKAATPAMRGGTLTHSAVLEPDVFEKTYYLADRCQAIKKSDKLQCSNTGLERIDGEWRCGVHGGASAEEVVSPQEFALCTGVRESFRRHTRANALLSGPGMNELSLVWIDEETGLKVKARLDRLSPLIDGGAITDLKSTKDARMRPFAKSLYQYGYHRQGALYLPGARGLGLDANHYVICAFEKEPPYPVAAYRLDSGALDAGEVEVRRLMRLYADCLSADKWPTAPSYPDTIEDISIPSWAFEMIDTGTEYGA